MLHFTICWPICISWNYSCRLHGLVSSAVAPVNKSRVTVFLFRIHMSCVFYTFVKTCEFFTHYVSSVYHAGCWWYHYLLRLVVQFVVFAGGSQYTPVQAVMSGHWMILMWLIASTTCSGSTSLMLAPLNMQSAFIMVTLQHIVDVQRFSCKYHSVLWS